MSENKNVYFLISIVAMVAIVGIVTMIVGSSGSSIEIGGSMGDLSGMAYGDPGTGRLNVTTNVESANVLVYSSTNVKYDGVTTLKDGVQKFIIDDIAVGEANISVSKAGLCGAVSKFTVSQGDNNLQYLELKAEATPTCTDSDGGNYPNVYGEVTVVDKCGVSIIDKDTCVDAYVNGQLKPKIAVPETYCNGTNLASAFTICPNGCDSGACKAAPCTDECSSVESRCNFNDLQVCTLVVNETTCPQGNWKWTTTYCPNGCENSACRTSTACTETDNGKDFFNKGTTTKGRLSATDNCSGTTNLFEHYCDENGNLVQNFIYSCPNGCLNGACKVTCTDECTPAANPPKCTNGKVQTCVANADADTCYEWNAGTACPTGQVCTNGVCQAAPTGTLTIISDNDGSGAYVFIDDVQRGILTKPISLTTTSTTIIQKLALGTHVIKIKKGGYFDYLTSFEVVQGQNSLLYVVLEKTATLTVYAQTFSSVYIDGIYKGKITMGGYPASINILNLKVGAHTVKVISQVGTLIGTKEVTLIAGLNKLNFY